MDNISEEEISGEELYEEEIYDEEIYGEELYDEEISGEDTYGEELYDENKRRYYDKKNKKWIVCDCDNKGCHKCYSFYGELDDRVMLIKYKRPYNKELLANKDDNDYIRDMLKTCDFNHNRDNNNFMLLCCLARQYDFDIIEKIIDHVDLDFKINFVNTPDDTELHYFNAITYLNTNPNESYYDIPYKKQFELLTKKIIEQNKLDIVEKLLNIHSLRDIIRSQPKMFIDILKFCDKHKIKLFHNKYKVNSPFGNNIDILACSLVVQTFDAYRPDNINSDNCVHKYNIFYELCPTKLDNGKTCVLLRWADIFYVLIKYTKKYITINYNFMNYLNTYCNDLDYRGLSEGINDFENGQPSYYNKDVVDYNYKKLYILCSLGLKYDLGMRLRKIYL
jgi:hypothetical protein